MSNRIANEGPPLSESVVTVVSGDGGASVNVLVRQLPDDPLCLRVSLGGGDGDYYCVYRGAAQDIETLLKVALSAVERNREGTAS